MSSGVGVWEPKKPVRLDLKKLRQYVSLMGSADSGNLAASMSADDVAGDADLMRQPAEAWTIAESLDDDDLIQLIRFFTLAEMQLTGWNGGKDSPVIPLARLLKARGAFDTDLRKWIKTHTDNRYLPYGSAL